MTDTVTLLRSPPSHMGLDNWSVLGQRAADEIEQLRATLKDANDMCRSAYQVAVRFGEETNWRALTASLDASLRRQHAVMHCTDQQAEDTTK